MLNDIPFQRTVLYKQKHITVITITINVRNRCQERVIEWAVLKAERLLSETESTVYREAQG